MTAEAVAACEGALAGGATDIVVNDAHGDMRNIDHDALPNGVRLIRGSNKWLSMVQGVDLDVDAILYVGYHAAASTTNGILDHTYMGLQIQKLLLNGEICSEARLNSLVAGAFGVPAIFISGDQTTCADASEFMPWMTTVSVKTALGRTVAMSDSPAVAREKIAAGVEQSLRALAAGECRPYVIDTPFVVDVYLFTSEKADVASMMPGVERQSATTVRYTTDSAVELLHAVTSIARIASTVD
jgi:D-amino peptidase